MTEANPFSLFESVINAFQRAGQHVGGMIDRYYTIGEYFIHIQFAGSALVPLLTPALEHLTAFPTKNKADLTICVWDSASTDTSMPELPWGLDNQIARRDVPGHRNIPIRTMLSGDSGAVSMLNEPENLGVFWIGSAAQLPTYERGAPMRVILHWWMRQRGCFLIHAGAVGHQEDGVLLVGKGGSGKSTCSLVSLVNGWSYAGDDYCLLDSNSTPYVYSLYNSAKLNAAHLEKFPTLLAGISNPEELINEKALVFLHQHQPTSLISGLPVKAIFIPRITGRPETVAVPTTAAAALQALAPSSLFQLPGTGQSEFHVLADFVKKVPCYHLELGTKLEQIPQTMLGVLNR